MLEAAVARRYGAALFSLAEERGAVEEFGRELKTVVDGIRDNGELQKLLYHRLIPPGEKRKIIEQLFSLSGAMAGFLGVVLDKRRERYLDAIYRWYMVYARRAMKLCEVEVRSAVLLSEETMEALRARLEKLTGKRVVMTVSVDPSLLGGVLVRIGDQMMDGSLKKRLHKLKELLVQDGAALGGGRRERQSEA